MKKLLLLSLVLCIGIVGVSQNKSTVKKDKNFVKFEDANFARATDDATNFYNPVSMFKGTSAVAPDETIIGLTVYDLLGNSNVTANRFWRFEDGTMAAVWTMGFSASAFPNRGTGYNYYDGTAWGPPPTERIEDTRCGWPNITSWGDDGEVGLSHNGTAGLEMIQRETKGTGDWTQTNFLGPAGGWEDALTWPRLISSGENHEYIHQFSNTNGEYLGQSRTNVYSRSNDGGVSWDPHNVVIPGMGEDDYLEITQDKAVFASRGNTVCILYVDAYTDLFYMRSDDNGDTWDKHIVWEHPVPFYDPASELDSCFTPDHSGDIAIDNQGHVHVVFGLTRYVNDADGYAFDWENPKNDGIIYWNDMMERFSPDLRSLAPPVYGYSESELIEDVNYIGWMQDVDGDGVVTLTGVFHLEDRSEGLSSMPAITVDNQGRIFVIFSSVTETYVYTGFPDPVNLRHIWARAFANTVWGEFMDVTADDAHLFHECVYPMIGKTSDNNIHYIYKADFAPGNGIDGPQDWQDNWWYYGMLPKLDLITGISEQELIDDSHVSQNFPNPFNNNTTVSVNLEEAANLSLVVTNLTGQKILEISKGQVPAQTHTFTIAASNFQAGIYFYTVTAGTSQVTRKMIVE